MKSVFKIMCLLICAGLITNCAAKKMEGQVGASAVVEDNGSNSNNGGSSVDNSGGVNEPLVAPDLQLKAVDIPNDILNIIQQPIANPTGGNFLSNLLGGSGCGLLNTILSVGVMYFTGGNALLSSLVPSLTSLLFKCGSNNSTLVNLIPNGSTSTNQVFSLLSHVLQLVDKGKDPTSLINAIKNPQDIGAMLNIVLELTNKTNDPKLKNILGLINNFQNNFQGSVGTCGSMNTFACEAFNIINMIRQQNGLQSLVPNDKCTAAAQSHSKDMFSNSILTHLSSNGQTAKERLVSFGVDGNWAENIVKGSTLTPAQAVQMWMNSDGHKKNILNPLFTSSGIGFLNGYFTQCLTN